MLFCGFFCLEEIVKMFSLRQRARIHTYFDQVQDVTNKKKEMFERMKIEEIREIRQKRRRK